MDPLIVDPETHDLDFPYLWLSAWLIDYVWRATARANFDELETEISIIEASPHVLRIDGKAFIASCSRTNKSLISVRKVIESLV